MQQSFLLVPQNQYLTLGRVLEHAGGWDTMEKFH